MSSPASIHPRERIPIRTRLDVGFARRRIREIGGRQGLSGPSLEALAIAVTEIATNIVEHADAGEILVGPTPEVARRGIVVIARDHGPGIANVELALRDGYSTGNGLGLGLPGARRLADVFAIESVPGRGTIVTLEKWAS